VTGHKEKVGGLKEDKKKGLHLAKWKGLQVRLIKAKTKRGQEHLKKKTERA